jgi:hypothetical protein
MHIVGINPKGDTHSPYMVVLCVDRARWKNEKRIDLCLYKKLIEGGEAYLGTRGGPTPTAWTCSGSASTRWWTNAPKQKTTLHLRVNS